MTSITLPWPSKELSTNARLHWRAVHKAKVAYKDECLAVAGCKRVWKLPAEGRIALTITLSPPDNRRRDRDNMQAALKYGLDYIADLHGVDDNRFDPAYRFAEPVKGGRVTVEVAQ